MVSLASGESSYCHLRSPAGDHRDGESGLVFAGTGILGRLFLLRLCVLHSSLGHLFHTQEEKQSLGRVYGYFPPNCQSWFTISGDKVWLPLPPQDSGHRGALSELPGIDLLHFTDDGETGGLPIQWPRAGERDPETSVAGWSPDSRYVTRHETWLHFSQVAP